MAKKAARASVQKKATATKKTSKKTSKKAPAARKTAGNAASMVHELEITLLDVEPRIWRRFVVRSDTTLAQLHHVVQIVMGWTDSHMHQFKTPNDTRYALPSPFGDPDWDEQIIDAHKAQLAEILSARGAQLLYQYDFGDGWEHLIKAADIRTAEPREKTPHCLAGERNCPPEDCGGPYGYPELLAALANPKHPDHADMAEWLGDQFDAELFDLDEVNEILTKVR